MLKMQDVSKVYRTDLIETFALRNFSLEVTAGEFVAVTGPSGSGKTTFLNVAGLLETFESGGYVLDGSDVRELSDDARSRHRDWNRRHVGGDSCSLGDYTADRIGMGTFEAKSRRIAWNRVGDF